MSANRFRSASEHQKAKKKLYTGPQTPLELRNGVPTKVTTSNGVCERCGANLGPGEGWLITLPRGNGRRGSFAAMCKPTCHDLSPL
jgi:hypothetical protein